MKKFKLIPNTVLSVVLALSLTACSVFGGSSGDTSSDITDSTPHIFKHSEGITAYGYYDIGNCRKLLGEAYTLVIFLDDDVSSWNEESRSTFYNKRFFPSINYLKEEAELRNVDLTLQSGQYTTKSDLTSHPRYRGVVEPTVDKAINNLDIFAQTAETMGFPNKEVMHAFLQNSTGVEQIAYILVLNKSGRAYAVSDTTYDDKDAIEFIVAFSSNERGEKSIGSSILHELLHLFGATDLYDPNGEYPERLKLCKKLYPNDIMMKNAYNPNNLDIGRLTECLIGWSDYFPPECDCPQWWETDKAESHRQ